MLRQAIASLGSELLLEFPGHWPRSHAFLSASEGDEGRTRMKEFHDDLGNGEGVKRGHISSRLVAHLSHS
jgi:hypothetical protein